MKKVKKSGYFVGRSEYAEGKTVLNQEQKEILKKISSVLNYSDDNYDNLPSSYAAEGIISVLRDQVMAKLQYQTISIEDKNKALSLIELLKEQIVD